MSDFYAVGRRAKLLPGKVYYRSKPVTSDFTLEESLRQASLTFCPGYGLPGQQKLTVTVTAERNVF